MNPALHARQRKKKEKVEPEKPAGPTKSEAYNEVYLTWMAHSLAPETPECEECGTSLVDREVYDIGKWVCHSCFSCSGYVPPPPLAGSKPCQCGNLLTPSEIKHGKPCKACVKKRREARNGS